MTLALPAFLGQPKVTRFGIDGSVCADELNDTEANVMCREIGFSSGRLLHSAHYGVGGLIILTGLKCAGSERYIKDCSYARLSEPGVCKSMEAARIICFHTQSKCSHIVCMYMYVYVCVHVCAVGVFLFFL